MQDGPLRYGTDDLTFLHDIALLDDGGEGPLDLTVQSRRRNASVDEVAHGLHQDGERPQDPIVHRAEQARAELGDEGLAGSNDLLARLNAGGILVNLDNSLVLDDLDDLAHEGLLAHLNDIVHPCGYASRRHDRACDPVNYTLVLIRHLDPS